MAENIAEDPIYKFLRRRGVDDGVMKNMKDKKVLPLLDARKCCYMYGRRTKYQEFSTQT